MEEAIETGDPAEEACSNVDAVEPTLITRESDCPAYKKDRSVIA